MRDGEEQTEKKRERHREITIKLLIIMYVFVDYLPSFHFGDFACPEFFQSVSRINKPAGKTEYQKHCV